MAFFMPLCRNVYGNESHDALMRQTSFNASLIESMDRGKIWVRSSASNRFSLHIGLPVRRRAVRDLQGVDDSSNSAHRPTPAFEAGAVQRSNCREERHVVSALTG
jgi:hypothetical protein